MRDTLRIMLADLRMTKQDLQAFAVIIGAASGLGVLIFAVLYFGGWVVTQILPGVEHAHGMVVALSGLILALWWINANDRAIRERNAKRAAKPREYDAHL